MPRMISYAQNFEDVMLERAFRGQRSGFYVDVGAAGPIIGSVTKHFYERGWRGINVEPVNASYRELVRDRPDDVNLCMAVGRARERLTMFEFELEGVSTFDASFAQHFIDRKTPFVRRPVDMVPLREICQEHCRGPIDFMKIDVEGWERPVLEGGDWNRFRPRVLLIEATKPSSTEPNWSEWEPFVLGQGYLFAYFDGLNRFYVPREERGLLEHFRLPPNVLDDFEMYATAYFRNALTPRGFVPYLVRGIVRKLLR